jgi:dCMP deaminase
MLLATHISDWSKDKNTKVGAVIVNSSNRIVSTGYNGMVIGANDDLDNRHLKENKYFYFEHAERNAIYSVAAKGDSTKDTTIYVTHYPCADCARGIIQSGIKRVVYGKEPDFSHMTWGKSWSVAAELFQECNIITQFMDYDANR